MAERAMERCRTWTHAFKAALVVSTLALGGQAAAQGQTFYLNGSDTLEDVVRDSITAAAAAGYFSGGDTLVYLGGGSGAGENGGIANKQSIAPMSRNLQPSAVGAGVLGKFDENTPQNVVGLDAAVIVVNQTPPLLRNISLPTFVDTDEVRKASPNVTASATAGTDYTQVLELILSGINGNGTTRECAHPARLQAILDLAGRSGLSGPFEHFLRRDDNSGTTNTFQDRLGVKRFCNGRARGVLGTVSTTNFNLNNQDVDPVRFPCKDPGTRGGIARLLTSCTNVSTGAFCSSSANPPGCDPSLPAEAAGSCPCTQGFVVALSQGDNTTNLADITSTIGDRVGQDANKLLFGFAGRESVRIGANSTGPLINATTFSDANVRADAYLLGRRLYVAKASANTDLVAVAPQETAGGGARKVAAETALFTFMADDGSSPPFFAQGACNIQKIIQQRGFITCTTNCSNPPAFPSLCAKTIQNGPSAGKFAPGPASIPNFLPNSGTGGPAWDYGTVVASAAGNCLSDGSAVAAGGTCPAAFSRPSGFACSANRECASNVCGDFGIGIRTCQ